MTIGNIGEKENEQKLSLLGEKIMDGHIPGYIQEELISSLENIGVVDKPLAVRSSATAKDSAGASFAGIHGSFLNVRGLDNILYAIKGCYASLWTHRAVSYRRKMNMNDDEVCQAVVIMEMAEAEAAGVAFTYDPRTGREDIVIISANFGLGESVVSGAVEPDEYCLDYWSETPEKRIGRKEGKTVAVKDGGTCFVKSSESAKSQVLSDNNIRKFGLLVQRIYDALGHGEQHQDIEWVFDGKDFALVQARPVTALPRYTFDELKNQPDMWSNANFKDAFPMVQSTLNWGLWNYLLAGVDQIPKIPKGIKTIKLYQGLAYWNLSFVQWVNYDAFKP